MEVKFSKSGIFLAICFACVSVVFYKKYSDEDLNAVSTERKVIDSWNEIIQPPEKQFKKLAVGINSNIDVIVSGVELLTALGLSPGNGKDNEVLTSASQLQETFTYFFARGSAAERAFTDPAEYQKILQVAESLNSIEHYVGGNAALMAKTVSALFPDSKIQFVGPVGPLLESLLPKNLEIPKSCKIARDEVHLIMEYKVGEKWGNATAPVATRFITSYDEHNSKILMMEPFFHSIKSYHADLMLLSGLNIMEGLTPDIFHMRLDKLISLVKEVPLSTPIHLELASMANKDYVKKIMEKMFLVGTTSLGLNEQELGLMSVIGNGPHRDLIPALQDQVVPHIDSLGLNEQELAFSTEIAGGPHKSHLASSGQPEIHKISDIMLWLLENYGRSAKSPQARLTRVHFHSLTYHIVAVVESQWSDTEAGTAAGTRVAGLQACDIATLDADQVELKIPSRFKLFSGDEEREFDPLNPVIQFRRGEYLFVFSPVLVCRHPVKTVGLGDAISATGLMFSTFKSS